jgi:hypothetical protein
MPSKAPDDYEPDDDEFSDRGLSKLPSYAHSQISLDLTQRSRSQSHAR